jgi:hypothetical protein
MSENALLHWNPLKVKIGSFIYLFIYLLSILQSAKGEKGKLVAYYYYYYYYYNFG